MAFVNNVILKKHNTAFWLAVAAVLVFIGINIYLLREDFPYLLALPLVLVLLWGCFAWPRKVFLLIAFLTPFSVQIDIPGIPGTNLQMFSEPLVICLMLVFLTSLLTTRKYYTPILRHPLAIVILFHLFWMLLTALTSTLPIVSIKYFIARFWFISVFFFLGAMFFRQAHNRRLFIVFHCVALAVIVFYTVYRHQQEFFDFLYANYASIPFYSNHGIYAAALALFIPILILFFLFPKTMGLPYRYRWIGGALAFIFIVGIIFSLTRAAWISVGVAAVFCIFFLLRIPFRTLLVTGLVIAGLLLYFWTDITLELEQNKQVSASDFQAHMQSIYNISTDASNLERVNRWKSAIRMFEERPLLGWGPNTYMFLYGAFQNYYDRTVISTNWGDQGNAHSEYIGPLAESGIFGMLSFLAIVFVSTYIGMRLFYHSPSPLIRFWALGILLGLITYFVHGLLNNYLDTDKASIPFWSFLAILTVLDIQSKKLEQDEPASVVPEKSNDGTQP